MEIFKQTNFDFLGKKWPFIILSGLLTLAGLVSLWVHGGPRYGIDFTGGALMDVNFIKRPPAEAIRSALHKSIPGEISVQEVSNSQGVGGSQEALITTSVRDENLQTVRNDIMNALNSAFNPSAGGKLDINLASEQDIVSRLRDPLTVAGAAMSDDAIQALAKGIVDYRTAHSGLIRGIDELSSVPGMKPQVMNVLRAQAFATAQAIEGGH